MTDDEVRWRPGPWCDGEDAVCAGHLPRTTDRTGNPLPAARAISTSVSPTADRLADVSNMVMAWGQFIDHDFTGTPVIKSE